MPTNKPKVKMVPSSAVKLPAGSVISPSPNSMWNTTVTRQSDPRIGHGSAEKLALRKIDSSIIETVERSYSSTTKMFHRANEVISKLDEVLEKIDDEIYVARYRVSTSEEFENLKKIITKKVSFYGGKKFMTGTPVSPGFDISILIGDVEYEEYETRLPYPYMFTEEDDIRIQNLIAIGELFFNNRLAYDRPIVGDPSKYMTPHDIYFLDKWSTPDVQEVYDPQGIRYDIGYSDKWRVFMVEQFMFIKAYGDLFNEDTIIDTKQAPELAVSLILSNSLRNLFHVKVKTGNSNMSEINKLMESFNSSFLRFHDMPRPYIINALEYYRDLVNRLSHEDIFNTIMMLTNSVGNDEEELIVESINILDMDEDKEKKIILKLITHEVISEETQRKLINSV